MNKITLRAVALALLMSMAACNASDDITIPGIECTGSTPDAQFVGSWRGQLAGRNLVLTLSPVCASLNFQAFWTVSGTWGWGAVSEGPTTVIGTTWWLKGNTSDLGAPFRGLTIVIKEGATPDSLTGTATGELPLSRSPSGSWQAISGETIFFVRQ